MAKITINELTISSDLNSSGNKPSTNSESFFSELNELTKEEMILVIGGYSAFEEAYMSVDGSCTHNCGIC
ncbi:hypothetical protein [Nostoc sp. LPT]|uniref:hypothetical protein n=1 Tax=Nostoc sp. LPT TaxID=2815387 RepID=UPI001D434E07|nr:hypothetical protein [Nostoc sp. LPT]MBN4007040.1 hypothetical protein [Nostoc sp. LPT]